MTNILPVNIYRAYDILKKLPSYATRKELIKSILSTGISMNTAILYFRALKNWGFIHGSKYLKVSKPKLEEFLMCVRRKVTNELGSETLKGINEMYSYTGSMNIKAIAHYLKQKGIDISEWKLKTAIRLLLSTNYFIWERKIKIFESNTDLKSIVLREILTRGACRLDTFILSLSNKLHVPTTKIKKALSELIIEKKISIDCPTELLNLWLSAIKNERYENIEIIKLSPQICEIIELYPNLFETQTEKTFMKSVMTGQFVIYPLNQATK